MDVLVTDKTGTLTEGRISFIAALDPAGAADDEVLRLGLLATEADLPDSRPARPAATRWTPRSGQAPRGAARGTRRRPAARGSGCCRSTTTGG